MSGPASVTEPVAEVREKVLAAFASRLGYWIGRACQESSRQ